MKALRMRYQTIEFGDVDIHVRSLRNSNEFLDREGEAEALGIFPSNWPIFGVLWESSRTLANLMMDYTIEGRRVLEVGCGLGLASLVLNHREADITATDNHPEVERFLQHNTKLNDCPPIPYLRADWNDESTSLGDFDLIIGSDLLYERGQAEVLSRFVDMHSRATCEVIIVDPGRGQLSRFSRLMVGLGYSDVKHPKNSQSSADTPSRGQTHSYFRD